MKDDMSNELYKLEKEFATYSVRKLTDGIKHSIVSSEDIVKGDIYVKIEFSGAHSQKYTLNDIEEILYGDAKTEINQSEELNPNIDYKCPFCLKDSPPPSNHKIIKYTFVSHENCVNRIFEDLEQLMEECPEEVTAELL